MNLVKKIALDQLCWAPIANGAFLAYSALAQGRQVSETMEEKFVPVMLVDWAVTCASSRIHASSSLTGLASSNGSRIRSCSLEISRGILCIGGDVLAGVSVRHEP